ncbi:MAG: aldo/keto reductase [Myxococcales bacterium]|nr:aldo/keto reductase [Myxococcales bacterium]
MSTSSSSRSLPTPRVGQGTWQMESDDRSAAIAALRRGLDLGLGHVDTAEMYGSGAVEAIVGEALAGRRDEVFLASKVLPHHADYAGTLAACEASLRRLRTDRLDLYMLHWPGPHPLEETFRAFDALLASGKILHAGVSNFDADELEAAAAIAPRGGLFCNQVLYHPLERSIEHRVLPTCERLAIPLVAYSPFGSGGFPSPRSRAGQALTRIADRRGATPHQVALAFLLRSPCVWTIPKAAAVAHVEDNAGALDLTLSADDLVDLEEACPLGPPSDGLPML